MALTRLGTNAITTIPSSAITALPNVAGKFIGSTSNTNFDASWNYTVNHGGFSNGEQRVTATRTPATNSTSFLINYKIGYIKASNISAIKCSLYINDALTNLDSGVSLFNQIYENHRISTNGTGYFYTTGSGIYSTTSTSSVKIGIYAQTYDEVSNSNFQIANTVDRPADIFVMEFAT
jgi:hypothetical protein